jgi:peroxiredoxin
LGANRGIYKQKKLKIMKNIKATLAMVSLLLAVAVSISAQNITFTSIEGEKIDLAAQKGNVVVLAIGANWLPLSTQQAESINKLAEKYAGKDVVFYFISTDSTNTKSKNFATNEEIRAFAKKNNLTVTVLRDSDGETSLKKFKIDQLPSFVILDQDGKLATEPFSGLDPEEDISKPISKEVDVLLKNAPKKSDLRRPKSQISNE